MKPANLFVLALAAACATGPAAAAAQTAQAASAPHHWSTPSIGVLLRAMPAPSCPVHMDLRHAYQFAPSFVGDGAAVQGPAPRILLILSSPNGDPVVKARVTFQGWGSTAQMVPAGSPSSVSGEPTSGVPSSGISRTIEADFMPGSDGSSKTELELPGFSAVRLARLEEVTFASGARLKFDSEDNCQTAPSLLVLVSAR